ncbi:drug resistance transporter, EmrB/QacA subfamily [Salinibacillus kushneri]|uniref:Drug resistance transporter, EmrB/QacA subfamily n=1 Tax=Salinibacillus kushneri TaxID=237682 RepID=A0A1I0IGI5_9BACI|nr:MFS transporter [Salinibacillus kushneri]SET96085.1 drug resistance transporter, EmrB/QacA subfamily [Salinibacillus kushneri]
MIERLQRPWLLVLTIGLGTLLNPLNSSMISVALTRLQFEFELTFADASWLISIFYLASAVGQPVMGKLSDMFGPKRLFITGLVLVAGACLLAPFSPNFISLLGCRALQAIGSSTLFPSGMSMVRSNITEKQGQALAALSIFANVSAAFGPSIGGFLVAGWDWPAIFLVNFPFIILSFVMALLILPNTGKVKLDFKRIDFIGIFFFVVSVVGLILFLLSIEQTMNFWALLIFLVAGMTFYRYENRHHAPFIDLATLKKNPTVTWVYLQFMTINLVYYCYFFGFPTFLQQASGYSEEQTGLIMLALAGFSVIISPLAGSLIDHFGSKTPMIIGALLLLAGTGMLLTYNQNSSLLWLMVIMAVLGMSNGFNNISAQTALFENVSREETGSASGLFQTSRYLGAILSGSLLGVTFNQYVDTEHLHLVAIICFVFCLVIVGLSFKLPGERGFQEAGHLDS